MDDEDRALSEMPPSLRALVRDSIAFNSLCAYWHTVPRGPWRTAKFMEHMQGYDAHRQAKYERELNADFEAKAKHAAQVKAHKQYKEQLAYSTRVASETGKPHKVRLSISELGKVMSDDNPSGQRRKRNR